jgi:hypothetical protein
MLKELLVQQREAILNRWFDRILETYPADTQGFLRSQKNQFANPVGNTISEGMAALFDALVGGAEPDWSSPFLDRMIRVRAVQSFSPSKALGFIFGLKEVVRKELGRAASEREVAEELRELERRVDALALSAFDLYMQCRERLYEIRANEVKNRTARLLKMANLVEEIPDETEAENGDSIA